MNLVIDPNCAISIESSGSDCAVSNGGSAMIGISFPNRDGAMRKVVGLKRSERPLGLAARAIRDDGDRARILPWPAERLTMGDDASQRNEPSHSKHGPPIKRVRQDQARSAADSTVQPPHRAGRNDAEMCALYCDRAALTDDQRSLAVRYIPMAQALARRALRGGPADDEELQSAAYMALVEAALTFDPSRRVNFAVYARHHIRGALRDYRRLILAEGWRGDPAHRPVFERLPGEIEDRGHVLGAELASPVGAELESTEAVERWLRRLPRAQAAACRLIYLHGMSQDEAAALVGCSKSYMSRLHRDAIARLIQDYHAASGGQSPAYPADES